MAEFIPPSNWDGVPNIENYAKWCEMLVSQKVGYPVEATVKLGRVHIRASTARAK